MADAVKTNYASERFTLLGNRHPIDAGDSFDFHHAPKSRRQEFPGA
jgi:hypothetical protein